MSDVTVQEHYDAEYFHWQASIGEFSPWANRPHFTPYVEPTSRVLDFGCGGGFMLASLDCAKRVGVEINAAASEVAAGNGIEMYADASEVPDNYVDVVISDNALEHTLRPFDELKKLQRVLSHGGTVVLIVPCEGLGYEYEPADVNQHLYSWSPMAIGNLLTAAGFTVIESKPYLHKWPPRHEKTAEVLGYKNFQLACRVWARLERIDIVRWLADPGTRKRPWSQVRVVARKAAAS